MYWGPLAISISKVVARDPKADQCMELMCSCACVPVQGLLLPLCQAGDCNLREAVIISSVLKRVSLPVLHSAAAILRIADMAYSGTNSFFIRVLLDKKYALPYRVVCPPCIVTAGCCIHAHMLYSESWL